MSKLSIRRKNQNLNFKTTHHNYKIEKAEKATKLLTDEGAIL